MSAPPEALQQCTGVLLEHRDGTLECTEGPTCSLGEEQHDLERRCGEVLAACGCSEAAS